MNINLPKEHLNIFKVISEVSKKLDESSFLIGGYVRDLLLNRASKDIDIVTDGDGIRLAEAVNLALNGTTDIVKYERFGTAMIIVDDVELEFVGARKESYRYDSRKPVISPGTIDDDQRRRDFTVNALAISLNEDFGTLVDPFQGQTDLQNKILRTPLDPDITFSDDPLRMMRAVRFASQLGFTIDEDTYTGILRNAGRLHIISQERITTEFQKIISSHKPSYGFNLLYETKLLQEFFPEFVALRGVDEIEGVSHKDNFYHTLEVLDNVAENSDNVWLRWAAILHDIGKPPTKDYKEGIGWTFYGHEVIGAKMVKSIFKRMRLPLDHKMKFVKKLVRLHLRPIALTKENISDAAVRRLIFDAGEHIDDLMILCRADITSKNEWKVKQYLKNYDKLVQIIQEVEERDKLRNWQPPIDGRDIMNVYDIKPGPIVGEIKTEIREAILDGDIPNDYNQAYKLLLQLGEKYKLQKK